ncbi:lipopolysaccharide biosynthesis protein [Clostridium perfringens]|uniref:lipopolysaccharide biosynthesis protein n=1 Tax=Clostridium perfringens TaxID=1502 RepID=UPI0028E130A5|nr:lipopolysaccharide biosynthesis protein [Clostridium perfringens]MDT9337252.1 lipopolysaccharide biosynthesis protein [Clostridium perfringens]MDT9345008.1 lipopolysaccharide biosynthesis protein [Clostridium perfringens]MDT9348248.1 lipopolysaccharide biosynthesis protein [Clostridium perfringens]MDT9354095.1 lipopolysaccharide biosynthesis protein [Clostridium perfringens]
MNDKDILKHKVINAAKWSTITEIVAKLIVPITNMILARIISPEDFGVIATVNMVVSFVDMFTDAGFQKYIVQHEFANSTEERNKINVAFWTNLFISILLWIIIIIFSDNIANIVGNPGFGMVISIACIQLPLTSFSSIQMSIFRRQFDFKTLFKSRVVCTLVPFIITIPLALLGFKYWALIIGSIVGTLINALILTIKSTWKPVFYYNLNDLKDMLSFSIWTLIEAITIWLSSWVDVFIISNSLGLVKLGLYKNSISTVSSIMAIITGAAIPIVFSMLSRLQNNDVEFKKVYFIAQRIVAYLIFPIGIGVFLYSDVVTIILLGDKWGEASNIIAIVAIILSVKVVFGDLCSEIYRAKGKPRLSFMVQSIFLLIYIPVCISSKKYNFKYIIFTCIVGRLIIIFIHNIISKLKFNISFLDIVKNTRKPAIISIVMGCIGLSFKFIYKSFYWSLISIFICIIFYFTVVYFIEKKSINKLLKFLIKDNDL